MRSESNFKRSEFSPDGRRLASDRDQIAMVHAVASGQPVARFGPHDTLVSLLVVLGALVGRNLGCAEWRQYLPRVPYRKTCNELPAPETACRP